MIFYKYNIICSSSTATLKYFQHVNATIIRQAFVSKYLVLSLIISIFNFGFILILNNTSWDNALFNLTVVLLVTFQITNLHRKYVNLIKYCVLLKMKPLVSNFLGLWPFMTLKKQSLVGAYCHASDVYELSAVWLKKDFPSKLLRWFHLTV